ncbi:stress response protein SCP2 [Thermomonospora umbrina]|uniref:Stress response protein SCP2 n=2 Tax=Thermomonospora umbrina TaxID=111806 RepID=A0A3D9SPJ6_9ACTN|nr:stress response protein SCP2 [Thermomonospora umbrina]
MAELPRGANAPLSEHRVAATVSCAVPVDVSALTVGADLRARSDADLVFFNAPEGFGVRWSQAGGGQRIELDLDAVPADAQAVLIVVSLTGPVSFGAVPAPRLQLTAENGGALASFTVTDLGPEKAILGLEVYRRGDAWKVRALGQGYAGGLAELLVAHGIEVDDPGEPITPPPPPPEVGAPTLPTIPNAPSGTGIPSGAGGTGFPSGTGGAGLPGGSSGAGVPGGAFGASGAGGTGGASGTGGAGVPGGAGMPSGAASGGPGGAAGQSGSEVGYVERCWLVWEDASRSLAAFRSSTEHALNLRNDEIAGRAPRGRHQELMAAATDRLNGDAAQLIGELSAAEAQVTAEVAAFDGPGWLTWEPRTDIADGVLLGGLSVEELPGLRVPLVLRVPWRRGVWISRGALPGDSAAYAWSLITRFLAAVPPGLVGLEVIDASGLSGAGWLNGFDPAAVHGLLGGGVATGPAAGQRLRGLLDLVDLRGVGGDETEVPAGLAPGPPVRLTVVMDAGAALDGEDAHHLLRLVEDGPLVGVPVMLVETDTPANESVRSLRVRQACNNLPSASGEIADSWVGTDWTLTPDVLPDAGDGGRAPSLFAHVLGAHARAIASFG